MTEIVEINEIEELASTIEKQLVEFQERYKAYMALEQTFVVDESKPINEEIQRAKQILEKLRERESERVRLVSFEQEILKNIGDLKTKMKMFKCQKQTRHYNMKVDHDRLIDKFVEENKTNTSVGDFEALKKELLELKYMSVEHPTILKTEESMLEMFTPQQQELIKEWTHCDFAHVLFNSSEHDYAAKTSVFDDALFGKSKVLIYAVCFNNITIGGYVNALIDKKKKWIEDPSAFLFEIKGGEMVKYNVNKPQFAFTLNEKDYKGLCGFGQGYDLLIPKKNHKFESTPSSYDLPHPIATPSTIIKKIMVFQLIEHN